MSTEAQKQGVDNLPATIAKVAAETRQRVKNPHTVPVQEQITERIKAAGASRESASAASRPTKSDNKDVWVEHAVAQGMDRDEAEASTKAALVDAYGEK